MISEEFLKQTASLPGVDGEAFARAMAEPSAVSIKLNRRKCHSLSDLGYGELTPVKWASGGYYLDERPRFTLNPLLHAGVFYVQDASSMIYSTIVEYLIDRGLLAQNPLVADFCAAPGGKTTSIINAVGDSATVIANEFEPKRAAVLKENLLKWGFPRIMVTNSPTGRLAQACTDSFDLVAVDAPCSGEGMMRKDETAVSQWNPGLVRKCAALQREILSDAVDALKPGGCLIYSTCTFNMTENEENVVWMTENLGLETVALDFPEEWGIGKSLMPGIHALRFMPHLTRGEGLFAAVLRKPGDAQTPKHEVVRKNVAKKLKVILDGIPQVTMKGKMEIPASEWALSTDFPKDRYPVAPIDLDKGLSYLRHEAITLDESAPRGFVVVEYLGYPLGFVKNIGSRANNLFPQNWKIRNL